MGEAKKRRMSKEELLAALRGHHKPPEGMANVTGVRLRALAQAVVDLAQTAADAGLGPAVAAQVLVASGVDMLRANYGDKDVADVVMKLVDRRLEMPAEYWGAGGDRPEGGTPTS